MRRPDRSGKHLDLLTCGMFHQERAVVCESGGDEVEMAMAATAARAGDNRFDRITFDPEMMGGRACIRGMRVTVATIIDLIAEGSAIDDVLADYPYLEREDVRQALAYAAWLARDEVVPA